MELTVFEANEPARRLYAAYGFETIGTQFNEEVGQKELRLRLAPRFGRVVES